MKLEELVNSHKLDQHNDKSTSYVDEPSASKLLEFITRRAETDKLYTVFLCDE